MKWAGIGSLKTPDNVLKVMTSISQVLSEHGYILRSGGAIGSDSAFELGAKLKEIFYAKDATPESIELASKFHPAWNRCDDYARKLQGRNSMILLGKDLNDPVDFVICWTEGGKIQGGTGQGMRIALHYNIPIYNLAVKEDVENLKTAMKTGKLYE